MDDGKIGRLLGTVELRSPKIYSKQGKDLMMELLQLRPKSEKQENQWYKFQCKSGSEGRRSISFPA